MKNGDFPVRYVKLPEGNEEFGDGGCYCGSLHSLLGTTPLDGHATYVKQLAACYLPAKPKGSVGNPLAVWGGSHWLSFGHKS